MNLSNWNPFRFARRKIEEKRNDRSHDQPSTGSVLSRHDSDPAMPSLWRDPWTAATAQFAPALPENRWFGDFSPTLFQPSLDVVDEGRQLRITAELPGMSEDDIELSADSGILTIAGEKRTDATKEEHGCYRTERAYGSFQRSIPLPSNATTEGIEANFDSGVLTVRIPKSETSPSQGRRIPVHGRSQQ